MCCVEGIVIAVAGGKVELTLRNRKAPPSLEALEEGQVVRGKVKRIENFGVFVELDAPKEGGAAGVQYGPTGMAHLSELADEYVHDAAKLFKVDQRKNERENKRFFFEFKKFLSYFLIACHCVLYSSF